MNAQHDRSRPLLIDEAGARSPTALNGARWSAITDAVMGGVSRAVLSVEDVLGLPALRLRGMVSLENNGGFVQMALDLAQAGHVLDASGYAGIEVKVCGNGESYGLHLRTADLTAPWQSYRHVFPASSAWQTLRLPFAAFVPHRCNAPLALARLRRVGLVAIGRAYEADLALNRIALY